MAVLREICYKKYADFRKKRRLETSPTSRLYFRSILNENIRQSLCRSQVLTHQKWSEEKWSGYLEKCKWEWWIVHRQPEPVLTMAAGNMDYIFAWVYLLLRWSWFRYIGCSKSPVKIASNFFVSLPLRSSRIPNIRCGARDFASLNFFALFILLFEHVLYNQLMIYGEN